MKARKQYRGRNKFLFLALLAVVLYCSFITECKGQDKEYIVSWVDTISVKSNYTGSKYVAKILKREKFKRRKGALMFHDSLNYHRPLSAKIDSITIKK